MAGLTEAQLKPYLEVVRQYLLGKEHASVAITVRNGRVNINGSEDTVLVQNGRILGETRDKAGD